MAVVGALDLAVLRADAGLIVKVTDALLSDSVCSYRLNPAPMPGTAWGFDRRNSWKDRFLAGGLEILDEGKFPFMWKSAGYGTMVCALVTDSYQGSQLARLVHAVRATPWGSEMRSRFIFSPGAPDFIGPPMLDHCWTEMTHLASSLPRLFARVTANGPHGRIAARGA